jgi:hypothetical protein
MHEKLANSTSLAVWEIIFAQSVTFRVLCFKFGKYVPSTHRIASRLDAWLMDWSAKHFPHPLSLFSFPEEDEWAMQSFGSCQLLGLLLPGISSRLIGFDTELSSEEHHAVWAAFAILVRRKVYFETEHLEKPPGLLFISKNPTFTLRLKSLKRAFPYAKFIVCVRDPFQAVPSMVSYIGTVWHAVATPTEEFPFRDALQGMCLEHYLYPIQHATENFLFVLYEELKHNPGVVLALIEDFLDVPQRRKVEDQAKVSSVFKHEHGVEYVLGMTPHAFISRHSEVFELYPEYLYAGDLASAGL